MSEMTLWQSQPALSPGIGGPALAEAAEFFGKPDQTEAAAASYRWLLSRFGDTVCRDGKTGRQLVEAIPPDDPLRKAIEHRDQWPTGRVEAAVDPARNQQQSQQLRPHSPGISRESRAVFRGPEFDVRSEPAAILCSNSSGNERLAASSERRKPACKTSCSPSAAKACKSAHGGTCLLLPVGRTLVAIDTLGADKTHPPKILWTEDGGRRPLRSSKRTANRAH